MKNKIITFLIKQLEDKPEPVEVPELIPAKKRRPYGAIDIYVMGEHVGYVPRPA